MPGPVTTAFVNIATAGAVTAAQPPKLPLDPQMATQLTGQMTELSRSYNGVFQGLTQQAARGTSSCESMAQNFTNFTNIIYNLGKMTTMYEGGDKIMTDALNQSGVGPSMNTAYTAITQKCGPMDLSKISQPKPQ